MRYKQVIALLSIVAGLALPLSARAGDYDALLAQYSRMDSPGFFKSGGQDDAAGTPHLSDTPAAILGYRHHSLVLTLPLLGNESSGGFSLCLLYDYARTDVVDPISGTGFTASVGNDARNLGLGLHSRVTERLELEAVVGHSHVDSSTNSAYAGLIYNFDTGFGLGADLGRISVDGQDDNRLRAFARFFFR